ncbi:glycosyltransferase family 2 protein, partial [bacterium]|nr:glycosyltransferase family 2 protein [bacterium]
DCFAEDADLTVRLLANGWRVKGETQMIAHTEAPDTLYTLLRQRYRWRRGIFQAFFGNFYRLIT